MTKPKFSICLIVRNEEKTLPRLLDSLKEFRDRDGEIVIVDTGSMDKTVQVAKDYGCKVDEVMNLFRSVIDEDLAKNVNDFFVVGEEAPLVKAGDTYFNFGKARNYAATLASNDMIMSLDADEIVTALNIDKLDSLIGKGWTQFEHMQVFTHNPDGSAGVKFVQNKIYDRTCLFFENIVHEVMKGVHKKYKLSEEDFLIEHFQNQESNRSIYPVGLAVDCYQYQWKDRSCHYFARELFYTNRLQSAEKEFRRHLKMHIPPQEHWTTPTHMESMLYLGNIRGLLGHPDDEFTWYNLAMAEEPERREPYVRMAQMYKWFNDFRSARQYAEKAKEFPWHEKYGSSVENFYKEVDDIIDWAVYSYPKVSIIIPHIASEERDKKLERLLQSIKDNAGYDNYEIVTETDQPIPNNIGAPKMVKKLTDRSTGDLIMFLGNDCIMEKDCLKLAVERMQKEFPDLDGLVSLNDGYWTGEFATHFLISKKLL